MSFHVAVKREWQLQKRFVTDEDLCGRNVLPFSLYRYVKAHKLSSIDQTSHYRGPA